MRLIDYIFGSRRGRDANAVEKEALTDPFLADAIDGYDAVYGDHADRLAALGQDVARRAGRSRRSRSARRVVLWVSGAAAMVAVAIVAVMFFVPRESGDPYGGDMIASLTDESPEVSGGGALLSAPVPAAVEIAERESAESEASDQPSADDVAVVVADTERTADSGVQYEVEVASARSVVAESGAEKSKTTGEAAVPVKAAVSERAVATVTEHEAAEVVAVEPEPAADALLDGVVSEPDGVELVSNPEFEEYFMKNRRRVTDADGNRIEGVVVAEFRVNRAGVPSSIRITRGISQDVNREVIELLLSGPRWEPTGEDRIRIELHYR